eukprot:SM000048S16616  [mRNA]  locus=s48:689255:690620:- [translate_table: standard]
MATKKIAPPSLKSVQKTVAKKVPKLPAKLPKVSAPKLSLPRVSLPKLSARKGGKPSWLPGVSFGGDLVDPSWLDGRRATAHPPCSAFCVPALSSSIGPAAAPTHLRMTSTGRAVSGTRLCRTASHCLAGDYGFDPLALGSDPAALKWYREAELIHGRLALLAVVGIFIGEAFSGVKWFEAGAQPGALAPFSFGALLGTQLLLTGWVETKRGVDFFNPGTQTVEWGDPFRTAENFVNSTGQQGYPGGRFFDPFGLAGKVRGNKYVVDSAELARLQQAEIKHARLAMVAMLIFYFEAGQGLSPLDVFSP